MYTEWLSHLMSSKKNFSPYDVKLPYAPPSVLVALESADAGNEPSTVSAATMAALTPTFRARLRLSGRNPDLNLRVRDDTMPSHRRMDRHVSGSSTSMGSARTTPVLNRLPGHGPRRPLLTPSERLGQRHSTSLLFAASMTRAVRAWPSRDVTAGGRHPGGCCTTSTRSPPGLVLYEIDDSTRVDLTFRTSRSRLGPPPLWGQGLAGRRGFAGAAA